MRFVEVPPSEFDQRREGPRGRVSYPLLKQFLETGYKIARLDRTGMQQAPTLLTATLKLYVRNHDMPISIYMRKGEIYLVRIDINDEGEPDPNWRVRRDGNAGEPVPVTPEVIQEQIATSAKRRPQPLMRINASR